jgi:drug/metabolite transporter (DMT)-like permease
MAEPALRVTSSQTESRPTEPRRRPERARPSSSRQGSAAHLVAAFAAVYIIWGSTYLAIRYAIETMPPLLMAGVRFLIAGTILYSWGRFRERARASGAEWVGATVVGGLLLLGGNGAVSWSEQFVPSGLAALVVAITPFWMVLFEWMRRGGERPSARTTIGLAFGFAGLVILVGPSRIGGEAVDTTSAIILLIGSLSWAAGSIVSRSLKLPGSARLSTGMQMLAGGAMLVVAGAIGGETAQLDPSAFSMRSILALAYLIVFGAIIGFTAYTWLVQNTTAARLSTYAYVNPLVAVVLGWAFAGEPLSPRTLLAGAVILAAVAVITVDRARKGGDGH